MSSLNNQPRQHFQQRNHHQQQHHQGQQGNVQQHEEHQNMYFHSETERQRYHQPARVEDIRQQYQQQLQQEQQNPYQHWQMQHQQNPNRSDQQNQQQNFIQQRQPILHQQGNMTAPPAQDPLPAHYAQASSETPLVADPRSHGVIVPTIPIAEAAAAVSQGAQAASLTVHYPNVHHYDRGLAQDNLRDNISTRCFSVPKCIPLYVANLCPYLKPADLIAAFSPHDAVVRVHICESKENPGLCYAFVMMASMRGAVSAMAALHRTALAGRVLRISIASRNLWDRDASGYMQKGTNSVPQALVAAGNSRMPSECAVEGEENCVNDTATPSLSDNQNVLLFNFHYFCPRRATAAVSHDAVLMRLGNEAESDDDAEFLAKEVPAYCAVNFPVLRKIFDPAVQMGEANETSMCDILIKPVRQSEYWVCGSGLLCFTDHARCMSVLRRLASVEYDGVHYVLQKSQQLRQADDNWQSNVPEVEDSEAVCTADRCDARVPSGVTLVPLAQNRCLCPDLGGRCAVEDVAEPGAADTFTRSNCYYFKKHSFPSFEQAK